MSLSRRYLLVLGVLAGLSLALGSAVWAYLEARGAKLMADPELARRKDQPIPVRVALVEEVDIEQVIGATAQTTASETGTVRVGLSTAFRLTDHAIKKLYVHEGDYVKKGDPIIELEDTTFKEIFQERVLALQAAEAELQRTLKQLTYNEEIRRKELESAKANMEFRKQDFAIKQEELKRLDKVNLTGRNVAEFAIFDLQSKNAQARYDIVEAEWRLQQAEATVGVGPLKDAASKAQALTDVEKAKVDFAVARRDLERCLVRAPLDGFVDRIELVAGSVLNVDSVVTQVLKLDPIFVRVDFPQERIEELQVGLATEVVFDCFPKQARPFAGKVIRISPQVNPQLRVLPVVVEVKNPDNRIKAGVSSFVRLKIPKRTLVVPARAVIQEDRRAMVFRVQDGRARSVAVQLGHLLANERLPVSGELSPGDEVVIFHNFYRHPGELLPGNGYLKDGDRVNSDWRQWARRP